MGATGMEVVRLDERYIIQSGQFAQFVNIRGNTNRNVPAVCRETNQAVTLRLQKKGSLKRFEREFSYSHFLSPHRHIINTFDVRFCSDDFYGFVQEHVPLGYLDRYVDVEGALDDWKLKRVMCQISSALNFLHASSLVHRAVCAKNVAIFDEDMDLVKLCDFSLTHPVGTMVRKQTESCVSTPPEITECVRNEWYGVEPSTDVWGMAVLLYYSSTGSYPWDMAESLDTNFSEFMMWQKRKTVKVPHKWRMFSQRALRLFRRMFEAKESKRCSIQEVDKYVKDTFTGRDHRNSLSDEEDSDFFVKLSLNVKYTARRKSKQVKDWLRSGK